MSQTIRSQVSPAVITAAMERGRAHGAEAIGITLLDMQDAVVNGSQADVDHFSAVILLLIEEEREARASAATNASNC